MNLKFVVAVFFVLIMSEVSAASVDIENNGNQFACDFYRTICSDSGNIIFSPYSIRAVLAMTYAGARGATEKEMKAVLGFSGQNKAHLDQYALSQSMMLKNHNGTDISIANSLWPQKDIDFEPFFIRLIKKTYGATFFPIDFSEPNKARIKINTWVEKETESIIKDLIPKTVITSNTEMVLVNAIHFKGEWKQSFYKDKTKEGDFFGVAENLKTPMMFQKNSFRHGAVDNVQILEMPYSGDEYSMVIILPLKTKEMKIVEQNISLEKINDWLNATSRKLCEVTMPIFSATVFYSLKEIMNKMGLKTAFTPRADFSGMTSTSGLYISALLHKSAIVVDEKGSEAASATAVVMTRSGAKHSSSIIRFMANHPFIYIVRHVPTGAIIFIGRCSLPTQRAMER